MNFDMIVGGVGFFIVCLIVGVLALAPCWFSPTKVQATMKMQAELESARKLLEKTSGMEYRRQQFWNVK